MPAYLTGSFGIPIITGLPAVADPFVPGIYPVNAAKLGADAALLGLRAPAAPRRAPVAAPVAPAAPAAPPPPTRVEVEVSVQTAVAAMSLPLPRGHVGPDPELNEWGATAVGFPLWLWSEQTGPLTTSASAGPATITITATPGPVTFDLGDGTALRCETSTPYPAHAEPGAESPTCGHRYAQPGTYTITTTQAWQVTWEGGGFTGQLSVDRSSTQPITVMELVSVLTKR